jgi:hypothetical protein
VRHNSLGRDRFGAKTSRKPISSRRFPSSARQAFPRLEPGIRPELYREPPTVQVLGVVDVRRWPCSAGDPCSGRSAGGPCSLDCLMMAYGRSSCAPLLRFPKLNLPDFLDRDQDPDSGRAGLPSVVVNIVFFLNIIYRSRSPVSRSSGRPTILGLMTSPWCGTNSRNNWGPRRARRRAARVFVPLGQPNKAFPSKSRSGFDSGASRGSVFLAKSGAARYQVRAFSAPSPTAPHGSPQ